MNRWQLHAMDCRIAMSCLMEPDSIDAIVTDPPYDLTSIVKRFGSATSAPQQYGTDGAFQRAARGFMGKQWDGTGVAFDPDTWREAYRVLKPGGYLLAFGGSRTYHRLACAIEDAGFEIRDQLLWIYGSGFPKSHDPAWDLHQKASQSCGLLVEADYAETWTDVEGLEGSPDGATGAFTRPERDVRFVRATYLSTPVYACRECGCVLQPYVPEQNASQHRAAWCKSEISWSEQSILERWDHIQTTQGELQGCKTCALPIGIFADGAEGWIHRRASFSDGLIPWQTVEPDGSCPSYRSQSVEQLSRQSDAIRLECLAQKVRGTGTALKPAHEPIVMARKPLVGSVAYNLDMWGTGAINIDACRVGTESGRFPANIMHDGSDEVVACFPDARGQIADASTSDTPRNGQHIYGELSRGSNGAAPRDAGGSAARFFYCAKASKADREEGCAHLPTGKAGMLSETSGQHITRRDEGYEPPQRANTHPTVKPTDLMRYLCRLVTPPGGLILDPFTGSGSTGKAAMLEGFRFVGCEMTPEYVPIAEARIAWAAAQA